MTPTGQITENFSWYWALHSQNAKRARPPLNNTPDQAAQAAIIATAHHMETLRHYLGDHPIYVSSWYRSLKVNALAGSKRTSQHIKGQAVDFHCPGAGTVEEVWHKIKGADAIDYDQLILEYPPDGWIHISFALVSRRNAFIIDDTGEHV